jgi:hypothetical protein
MISPGLRADPCPGLGQIHSHDWLHVSDLSDAMRIVVVARYDHTEQHAGEWADHLKQAWRNDA